MNRHTHTQPQKRAARDKRGPRAPHTHCRHTTSATRRPAREERTAHTQFKFECDRAPSECAGPGSRRGRRHGLQLDGDGAASRRRYCAAVWSFDIRAPRPGSVCNSASIIRDAIAPRNNPRAGTTRGTSSSTSNYCLKTWPPRLGLHFLLVMYTMDTEPLSSRRLLLSVWNMERRLRRRARLLCICLLIRPRGVWDGLGPF